MSLKPLSASAGSAFSRAQTDDPAQRETHDFYPTHPGATRALLSVEAFDGPVWEPACGDGAMSRVLEAHGLHVVSTDLIDRGYGHAPRDFLFEWSPQAPHVVTNPPFRWAREFADRALLLTHPDRTGRAAGKVALFLRLAFLEGLERQRWFATTPLARVWVMSRRVPMARGKAHDEGDGHGVIAFAWFVWEHGHTGAPALGWLDWKAA